ncbi:basic proline-rich protein-like [Balaenoptera ricei]|uniref:basic proline-rich protein-like n=1 Tax=Balaenoptera ricei TaxID=2746895 RepID=UPI0028BE915C|nr:basic proline-rich protein-like [Balaenoptera ricei]
MGGPRPGLRPLRRARGAAAAASARPPGSARGAAPRPAPPPVPAPAPPPDPPHRPEGGAGAGLRTSRGRGRLGDRRPTHAPPAATEAPPAPTPPAPLLQLSRGSCRSCLPCRAGESLSRIPDPGSRILDPRQLPLAPDGSRKGQRSGSQGLGGRSVTKRQLDSRVFGLWEPEPPREEIMVQTIQRLPSTLQRPEQFSESSPCGKAAPVENNKKYNS